MRIGRVFRKHYYFTATLFATIPGVCFYLGLMGAGIRPLVCVLASILLAFMLISIMLRECYELYKFDLPDDEWPREVKNKMA